MDLRSRRRASLARWNALAIALLVILGPTVPAAVAARAPASSKQVDDAILAALDWLRRHQSPDGSWKAHDFTSMCKTPCANADPARYGDGRGDAKHDAGVTGLALLAFTGFGDTHKAGPHPEFKPCVEKAMNFLIGAQANSDDPKTHGCFGSIEHEQWTYDHAIATAALAELLAVSGDRETLAQSVKDAVLLCLEAQNPGMGWKYGVRPGKNDTSVTTWMVKALIAAKNCKLDIPEDRYTAALAGANAWLRRVTSSAIGRSGYEMPGDEGSRLLRAFPDPYPFLAEIPCMTASGYLGRASCGEARDSDAMMKSAVLIASHRPEWREQRGKVLSTINFYCWYFGAQAMSQAGGDESRAWSKGLLLALLENQRHGTKAKEEAGSWDPLDPWGPAGGRVYSTAMGALALEVYLDSSRRQGK
ncbi:MAG: hypothetical protein L0Z55_02305 [Planctomycetes bacterium]|nr:hypothetical protein [Planctomycetota bacterium]